MIVFVFVIDGGQKKKDNKIEEERGRETEKETETGRRPDMQVFTVCVFQGSPGAGQLKTIKELCHL